MESELQKKALPLDLDLDRNFSWRRVLLTVSVFGLIATLLVSLVGAALYQNERQRLTEKTVEVATLNIAVQKKNIAESMRNMAHSTLFFWAQSHVHDVFEIDSDKEYLTEDLLSYMKTNDDIDHVRVLNPSGMEVVRVNFNNGNPITVPEEELQDKSERYYFADLQRLAPGELYVSDLDLNIENETVELPSKPVIRLAMAIDSDEGERAGYLVINYLARDVLERFMDAGLLSTGDLLLINNNAEVVSSALNLRGWTKLDEINADSLLGVDLRREMRRSQGGVIRDGLTQYIYSTIHPTDEVLKIPALKSASGGAKDWNVLVVLDDEDIQGLIKPYLDMLILWLSVFVVMLMSCLIPLAMLQERKRIIQEYFKLLTSAVEHTSDSIFITKPNGAIRYVNPAFTKLTGYTSDEAMDRNPSELIKSTAQDDSFYKEMWKTISVGKVWTGSLVDRRKDGSLFPAQVTITPIVTDNNSITHYVAIIRDNTANQLLQDKVTNKKKMESLSVAVGGIAHEFNNILAGLMGNAYLAKQLNRDNPKSLSKLEMIETLGDRAAELIRHMLAYVGRAEVNLASVDLTEVCRRVVTNLHEEIDHPLDLQLDIGEQPVMVDADAGALARVLEGLVSNAMDAVEACDAPKVSMKLEVVKQGQDEDGNVKDRRDFAVITVSDNGSGIKPEHLNLIFEPFFTTKEVGRGSGLGLSDAYGVIRKHHGFIKVKSEPGQGALFSLFLPLMVGQ